MFQFIRLVFLFNVLIILLSACNGLDTQTKPKEQLYTGEVDSSVLPANDFYRYVNGKSIERQRALYPQQSFNYFDALQDQTDSLLFNWVKEVASNNEYPVGSDARKLNHFLSIALDTQRLASQNNRPIQNLKNKIQSIESKQQLESYLLDDILTGASLFFDLEVRVDFKNAKKGIAVLFPNQLGLSKQQYLLQDDESRAYRLKYYQFLIQLLLADGQSIDIAEAMAATTLKIETALAKSRKVPSNKIEDVKVSIQDLSEIFEIIDWPNWLMQAGLKTDSIAIDDVNYFKACNELVQKLSIVELKQYAHTSLLRKAAPYLSKNFAEVHDKFYGSDTNKNMIRWQRAIVELNQNMPDALGQIYMKRNFDLAAKNQVAEMADQIKWSFARKIKESTWLTDSSKQKALDKLNNLKVKIAYPDKFQDYVGLSFKQDTSASYFDCIMTARAFNKKRNLASSGQLPNESAWTISAQTVNAKYFLQTNEVILPGAILQKPFYNKDVDLAFNYGAIGAIIAHEISHAFDLKGMQYDQHGNFKPWYNDDEINHLNKIYATIRSQLLIAYPQVTKHPQLLQMVHESFADISAIEIAFNAMQHHFTQFPEKKASTVMDTTPEQRFFMAWARLWLEVQATNRTMKIEDENHPPFLFRVNGLLPNIPAFQKAFEVKPEHKHFLTTDKQIKIWD